MVPGGIDPGGPTLYPGAAAYGGPPIPSGPFGGTGPGVETKIVISSLETEDKSELRSRLDTPLRVCAQLLATANPKVAGTDIFDLQLQPNGKIEVIRSKPAAGLAEFDTCAKKQILAVTLPKREAPKICQVRVTVTPVK